MSVSSQFERNPVCTCACPRSQAGTMAAILPSWVPLGKSTHIEIRDVGGTFFVSFNGEVQCTIDYTGHVFHPRTDRDV